MTSFLNKYARFTVQVLLLSVFILGPIANAKEAPLNPEDYYSLDAKQIGMVRHMLKLSRQLPGDWSGMTEDNQDAYMSTAIFQLAFGAYGLGQAQYHYTPAYREVYREIFDSYIQKSLHHTVWNYWLIYSMGGTSANPDQKELFPPETNPVGSDNIMYSAHVLQMAALYDMFYRDGKYTRPASLTFAFTDKSWGFGPELFEYDLHSLTDHLYNLFKASDYVGIPCQRNAVFTECNQHPILAFMHHDSIYDTNFNQDVIPKFRKKWDELDYINPESKSVMVLRMVQQKKNLYGDEAWGDGWTGLFMNAWDKEYIESLYEAQRAVHVKNLFGRKTAADSSTPRNPDLDPRPSFAPRTGFGMFAAYAAEMGDVELRDSMLEHAEKHWSPTWEKETGRYYFPRSDDKSRDENGVPKDMNGIHSNGTLPMAYFGVKDGYWSMYNKPWSEENLNEPQVTGVDEITTSVNQAVYVKEKAALLVTLTPGPVKARKITFKVANLDKDKTYAIWKGKKLVKKLSMAKELKKGKYRVDSDGNLSIETSLSKSKPSSFVIAQLNG